jgi:hypothetical protein
VNRERLKELIKVLKAVKPNTKHRKFDMSNWFVTKVTPPEMKFKSNGDCVMTEGFCQTSACALGHAALHPKFQKQGLHVNFSPPDMQGGELEADSTVVFGEHCNVDAGAAFFGIERSEACTLFDPVEYEVDDIKPKHVIKRIEELLRRK